MRPRLTSRGHLFFALGVLTAILGAVLGYPDVTRIGALLAALVALAVAVSWTARPRLRVTRTVDPESAPPGETITVRLRARNTGRLRSPPLLAEERLDARLSAPLRFHLPRLRPGQSETIDYEIRGHHRGTHELGPLAAFGHDPFGLISTGTWLSGSADAVILPRVVPLGRHDPGGGGPRTEGLTSPATGARGEDDVTVREYRSGDELRRVHWASTARRGELMVRQEERPRQRRALVVLDSSRASFGEAGESFEWAVSAAASAVVHLERDGWLVHLVTGTRIEDVTHPVSSAEALRHLALLQVAGPGPAAVVAAARPVAETGALIVAFTGSADPEEISALTAVRHTGSSGMLFVVTDARTDGETAGVELAASSGWRVRAATPREDLTALWAETGTAAAPGRTWPSGTAADGVSAVAGAAHVVAATHAPRPGPTA